MTTAYDVHSDFKKEDINLNCLPITYFTLLSACDGNEQFWDGFRDFLKNNTVRRIKLSPHKPKVPQIIMIGKAHDHYQTNDKGKLIACCGSGKTLTSYWIFNDLDLYTCIIFVPSLELLSQTFYEWKREFNACEIQSEFLLIGSKIYDKVNQDSYEFIISTEKPLGKDLGKVFVKISNFLFFERLIFLSIIL